MHFESFFIIRAAKCITSRGSKNLIFGPNLSQTVGLEGQKPAKKSYKYPFSVLDVGFLVRFGKVRQGQA